MKNIVSEPHKNSIDDGMAVIANSYENIIILKENISAIYAI